MAGETKDQPEHPDPQGPPIRPLDEPVPDDPPPPPTDPGQIPSPGRGPNG